MLAKEVRSTITVVVIANYTTAPLEFTELVVWVSNIDSKVSKIMGKGD